MQPHPLRLGGEPKKLLIAFRAYKEGIWEAKFAPGRGAVLWNTHVKDDAGHDIFIRRDQIPSYMTDWFWSAVRVWIYSDNLQSLPFGGGWAENPDEIVQVVNLLRVANAQYEDEMAEKRREHDAATKKMEK